MIVAAPPRLRVSMFHTLPGEGRISSEVYAGELVRSLRAAGVEVVDVHPDERRPGRGKLGAALARHADRYLRYQALAAGWASEVNHIADHGYGHLGFSLDPGRTVVTFHDAMLLKLRTGDLSAGRRPWATIGGHLLSLRAIRRLARVITPSASARQDFLRFQDYPPERVIAIPEAVSSAFRPRPRAGTQPGTTILHVGHCGFYKNVETILRALPAIGRRLGRPARLRKVGGDFTRSQEELIGRLGIGHLVEHLGRLPEPVLARVYAEADVLLMPSLHEGFGLPVLEAMASGTAVIAADRGGLPEVVGEAGLLVEPEELDAIVDAVARVLDDDRLRGDLEARGLERARQFTWDRTAAATLEVYRAVRAEAA